MKGSARHRSVKGSPGWALELLLAVVLAGTLALVMSWARSETVPQASGGGSEGAALLRSDERGPERTTSLSTLAHARAQAVGGAARPRPRAVPPTGSFDVLQGRAAPSGGGILWRFVVEVERGLPVDRARLATLVQETLYDRRGWGASGSISFQRVDSAPFSFRVTLATPETTDALCAPLVTNGIYSCQQGDRAVLNYWRWMTGADAYGDDLRSYRTYMINHEVGHVLGHGHTYCPRAGARAPLMMQQTKGVGTCEPHPWPLPSERG